MKIFRDYNDELYNINSRMLGNCITVISNNTRYYYEFIINDTEALIKTDTLTYIKDVILEFRKTNKYVHVFYNESRSFYQAFDEVFTYKLPINIIQPSKFFINEETLNVVSKVLEDKEVYIPVCIINDEYVCIDGHTKLYAKMNEDQKMVNVYLDNKTTLIEDLVYMAKENNITSISKLEVLSKEDYNNYWQSFIDQLKQ